MMTIKEKTTGRGGNVAYRMQRSKYIKGPDGHGAVVTAAREALIAANGGKDPGYNVVAAHDSFGSHHGKNQDARWETRAYNTAESNMHRAGGLSIKDKIKLKSYKEPQKERTAVSEKIKTKKR